MEMIKDYTIVLSNKSLQHLGQLTGLKNVKFKANLNAANEISFTAYRAELSSSESIPQEDIMTYQDYIWSNLVDFKTIWVKELNEYFQIRVSTDDANDTIKTVNGTSLCESELSQTNLYNLEINSETDLAINDYEATTFYNAEDASRSLLHRILSKVPHYKIKHVDKSLCKLQRTFSVDGTSIYDFLTGECSEQFDCLFVFDTISEDGNTTSYRYISVYDLMTVCNNCGKRGDFTDVCPECKSTNLSYYGKDTTIYVDKNNLTDSIHFEMDGDNVKNCFKLVAGDETMTSAIRSLNPNGTDYLYILRDDDKKDMPKELVDKLEEYSILYESKSQIIKDLTQQEYDLKDSLYYYESSMMPSVVEITDAPTLSNIETPKEGVIYVHGNLAYLFDGTDFVPQYEDTDYLKSLAPHYTTVTASTEVAKLTVANLSPIALQTLHSQTSVATINTALKNYAKLFIKTGYVKLEIDENMASFVADTDEDGNLITTENGYHSGTWHGQFIVTNSSNETDIAYTGAMDIRVTDNYTDFLAQKAKKALGSTDDEEGSVFDILSTENMGLFAKTLTLYSKSRLESFSGAFEAALSVLQGKDQADKNLSALYNSMYMPYEHKATICSEQLSIIQGKIAVIEAKLADVYIQREAIQAELNLENHLGDLYPIFCSYKREDKYSNSNYISDGLNNTQLIDRATEFWELAQKEIHKSANGQYNISSTLHNLLAIEEFQPLTEYFELGNWIRIRVDGQLYRLRLISYEVDLENLQTLNVTFSTVTKIKNLKSERKSILENAKSLATNFGYVSKQAEKGQEANANMNAIVQNGLNSGLVQIKNNSREEVTYGKHGLLLREYDDILDDYNDKQCKLTHNAMVYTTDNWETASQAIGEHEYTYYDEKTNNLETNIGYGVTAQFCQSAFMYGGQILGSDIYSIDYDRTDGIGSHISLIGRGSFNFGKVLSFDGADLTIDGSGNFSGTITAKSGYIGSDEYPYRWTIGNDNARAYIYNGTDSMSSTTAGTYLGTDGFRNYKSSTKYVNISDGVLSCNGANITGTITASNISGGKITGTTITSTTIDGNTIKGGSITGTTIDGNTIKGGSITGTSISGGTLSGTTISGGSLSIGNDFSVNSSGYLKTSSGNIGGAEINGQGVYFNSSSSGWGLWGTTAHANIAIHAGGNSSNIGGAPFRVYHNGDVVANSITIGTNTKVGSTSLSSYIGNIAADEITATKINSVFANGTFLLTPFMHANLLSIHNNQSLTGSITISLDGSTGYISCSRLSVNGTKSRLVQTQSYNDRLLYCYEMPSPVFGDVGHGVIGEDGLCYIDIDSIFLETIDTEQDYFVFLQPYSSELIYVVKKYRNYFVVQGVPNAHFDWEIKAKQLDFPMERLEENINDNFVDEDYIASASNYLNEYEKELTNYEQY